MTNFFSRWSWLDDGVLPGLIAIIRACWVWPWLALVQLGLSPDLPQAALPLWSVLLLPILSFSLARWASWQPTATAALTNRQEPPLLPRILVGLLGIGLAVLLVWWQLYRGELSLLSFSWLSRMGDSLIHWPEAYVPPAVLLIVTGLFLWMRGLLDASHSLTHDTVWRIFLTGVVMMVLYLIVISLGELDRVAQLITSVLVMLAAGMGALAFSSVKITAGLDRALGFGMRHIGDGVDSANRDTGMGVLRTEAMPVVNRYWFMSVGGSIGLLMLLGGLLTLLIAPEVLEAALDVLWTIATFIGDIVFNVLIGLAYVASVIVFFLYQLLEPLINRLMERINLDPELLEGLRQEPQEAAEAMEVVERAPVPDEYRWLGLIIVGIITLIAFVIVIRRLSSTNVEVLDEDRESILSADLLQDQLSNLWDRLRGRFRTQDPDDPFFALDGEESRRRIRAVYQSLLSTATELGQPRGPSLTPVEYGDRLAQVSTAVPSRTGAGMAEPSASSLSMTISSPDLAEPSYSGNDTAAVDTLRQFYGPRFAPQLERITAGYVAARYGDESPPTELAADVEAAWREIESGLTPK